MRNATLLMVLTLFAACGGGDATPPATDTAAPPAEPATRERPAAEPPAFRPPKTTDAATGRGPQYAVDNAIAAPVRSNVGAEQTRLLDAVRNGDPSVLGALLEQERQPQAPRVAREFFDRLREAVTNARVEPWHDFHVLPDGQAIAIETDDGVRVAVPAAGREVYISLQQLRAGFRDGLLAAIWVKRAEGWRLLALRLGAMRLDGKTAMEWYREAGTLAAGGKPLPAWLRLTVADDLLDSVPFVAYVHADDARRLEARLGQQLAAQHAFPLPLPSVADDLAVVRIDPTFLQGDLSPLVHFVTRRSLQDSKLGDEAQAVVDALGGLYPGFCEGATRVAVAAYNEVPLDPRGNYPSAGFVANCP